MKPMAKKKSKSSSAKKPSRPEKSRARKVAPKAKAQTKRAVPAKAVAKKKPLAKPKAAAKAAPGKAAPAKAAAKAAPAKKKPAKAKPVQRRDGAGHMNPKYAALLRSTMHTHENEEPAFVGGNRSKDDLAEELGEEAVESMTSGEYEAEDALNESVPEDRGGPFVPSTAGVEYAEGRDASNPRGAKREPFPRT
jgi:hypothetical protein